MTCSSPACDVEFSLQNACRTCLSVFYPLENIFDTYLTSEDPVYRVLNYVFGLEISLDDGLPPNICVPCLWKTREFFTFKRNVYHADFTLNEMVSERGSVALEEEAESQLSDELKSVEHKFLDCPTGVDKEWKFPVDTIGVQSSEDNLSRSRMVLQGGMLSCIKNEKEPRMKIPTSEIYREGTKILPQAVNDVPSSTSICQVRKEAITSVPEVDFSIVCKPSEKDCNNRGEPDCGMPKIECRYSATKDEGINLHTSREDRFNSSSEQEEHGSVEGKNKEESIICHYCNTIRRTKEDMKNHIFNEHRQTRKGVDIGRSKNLDCNSSLKLKKDGKCYRCMQCEYNSAYKSSLKRHIKIHTGEKPFRCMYCEYKSLYSSALKAHILTHTGEKPFRCLLCDFRCSRKSNLKAHIRKHTGEKPFTCTHCDFRCSQRYSLKAHIRIHTGEKPFRCTYCDYSYSRESSLKRHILAHTGWKPFRCLLCDYRCSQKSHLRAHIRKHTGEKPFTCTHCDYRSSWKSDLRIHAKKHKV